jgi:hypothetical protein
VVVVMPWQGKEGGRRGGSGHRQELNLSKLSVVVLYNQYYVPRNYLSELIRTKLQHTWSSKLDYFHEIDHMKSYI